MLDATARDEAGSPGRGWAAVPWVGTTYLAEGLPYSLIHQVLALEYFTAMGVSLESIGLASLYHVAWNAKFLWSPLVERWGTTRRWILAMEALLGLCFLGIAWATEHGGVPVVALLGVPASFLAATHDIAIDGFYLRALDRREQAALSGGRTTAYRLAMLLGKSGLVSLAGLTSWQLGFGAGAGLLLLLLALHAWLLPHVDEREAPAATPTRAGRVPLRALWSFLDRPRIAPILAFILVYRAGDSLLFAMSTPLLKDLGLGTTERGVLANSVGTLASVAGALLGGALVARLTLKRTLFPIAAAQALAILLYAWMAWARPGYAAIGVVVAIEQLVAGVGTAAFVVYLMQLSSGPHKVSHFAVATALMTLGSTLAGTLSGFLAERVGFTAFFELAFLAAIPGVALSRALLPDAPTPPLRAQT